MAANESTDSGRDAKERRGIRRFLEHSAESARQLMQPSAFRITLPQRTDDPFTPRAGAPEQHAQRSPDSSVPEEQLTTAMKTLAAVATAVWRAKSKLDVEAQAELPSELRHLPRHIHAAWDALAAGHVQVDDPVGQPYVPGVAVNVLAFQPLEGIGTEVIHETIKPTVYFGDTLIQRADVIVGRPPAGSDGASQACPPASDTKSNEADSPEQKGPKDHAPNDD